MIRIMTTPTQPATLTALFDEAEAKLATGTFSADDLRRLRTAACGDASGATSGDGGGGQVRQRLLYLQATSPFIGSELISAIEHAPEPGGCGQLDPTKADLPYQCVHDALADGWHVIHFPQQRLLALEPTTENVGVLGYEFILAKYEVHRDESCRTPARQRTAPRLSA